MHLKALFHYFQNLKAFGFQRTRMPSIFLPHTDHVLHPSLQDAHTQAGAAGPAGR